MDVSKIPGGDTPDRRCDDDVLKTDDVVNRVTSITNRAQTIMLLLVRAGIPFSPVTYAALGTVYDALGDLIDKDEWEED